jgi:uncharacterized membrane protein (DUF106 family)
LRPDPVQSQWERMDLAKVQQSVLHQINVSHGAVDERNQHLGRTWFTWYTLCSCAVNWIAVSFPTHKWLNF